MKLKSAVLLLATLFVVALISAVVYKGVGTKDYFAAKKIKQGLDLKGGVSIVYEAVKEKPPTPVEMSSAISLIRQRLDKKSYTEAEVSQQGERRIRVEIPGVSNPEKAVKELGQTAQLKFIGPDGVEILSGTDVKSASKQYGQSNPYAAMEPYVSLEFNDKGKKAFAEATKKFVGKPIYILLDQDVLSAPTVQQEIRDGNAMITGKWTEKEVDDLANLINSGSLPFNLEVKESSGIGAKLGADAVTTSVKAGIIAFGIVLGYMIVLYRLPGFASDIALVAYIALLLGTLSIFGVTLTLPGVAGIILSIGMAVDANVIIFSRIKEELNKEKSLKISVDTGFHRALSAIIDSNVSTILTAGVLFYFGTGPIKGFAAALFIGVVISMFTALFLTRFILNQLINLGIKNTKLFGAK